MRVSWCCQVHSLSCWTVGLEAAWTCISPGMSHPVVWCGHCLSPSHDIMPLALQMMLTLSAWIPVVIMSRDLLQFLPQDLHVYLSNAPPYPIHILHGGRLGVIGHQSSWEAVSTFCTSQNYSSSPKSSWMWGSNGRDAPNLLLHLLVVSTSCIWLAKLPPFTKSARATYGLHLARDLLLGSPHPTRVPCPLQMLPSTSVR